MFNRCRHIQHLAIPTTFRLLPKDLVYLPSVGSLHCSIPLGRARHIRAHVTVAWSSCHLDLRSTRIDTPVCPNSASGAKAAHAGDPGTDSALSSNSALEPSEAQATDGETAESDCWRSRARVLSTDCPITVHRIQATSRGIATSNNQVHRY